MSVVASQTGSAERNGELWGARPHDWAINERQQVPTYEEAIRCIGLTAGQRVLEVGCGTGTFLHIAAGRGAEVYGLDAAAPLLEIARTRVPDANLRVADMQFLPYEDDFFDVVAGFNSFFFAADMTAALCEAGRVAKPGAPVVIQVWGHPERCDLSAMRKAAAPFMPPPPPDAPEPPQYWRPGVLEGIATDAGLVPDLAFDVSWAYEYADADELGRAMIAPGPIGAAARAHGEDVVRSAIVEAMEPRRTYGGGYWLMNEWHFLIARAA